MTGGATSTELVKVGASAPVLPMPAAAIALLQQTPDTPFAADEFSRAGIGNEHTRRVYGRIVGRFPIWCGDRNLELHNITPGLAAVTPRRWRRPHRGCRRIVGARLSFRQVS